jgi:hypothetical protein
VYEDNNGSAFPLSSTMMQAPLSKSRGKLESTTMSRTVLSFALVICCALALMPLLVRPTPVGRDPAEHAVADTTQRAEDLRAAQVTAAGYMALAVAR